MDQSKSVSSYNARHLNQRRDCISGIIGLGDAVMEGIVIIGKLLGYLVHFLDVLLMSHAAGNVFLKSCEHSV
jgi:hypothetical protein